VTDGVHKIAAVSGWIFVIFLVAGNLLPGLPPDSTASAESIVVYFEEHRSVFLCAVFLEGLSVCPFLLFAFGVASALKASQDDKLPSLLVAFASVAGAVALAIASFWAVLAYRTPQGFDASVTRALFDLGNLGYNFIGFPFGAFLVLACLRIRKLHWGHPSLYVTGFLAAIGQLLSCAAFARTGILSPGGPAFLAAFVLFALWIVLASVRLWTEQEAGNAKPGGTADN
jgi:hypothetical protein